jgi:hypothetical protein
MVMKNNKKKPIVYIDMDGTLVDFVSAFDRVEPEILREYGGRPEGNSRDFCADGADAGRD